MTKIIQNKHIIRASFVGLFLAILASIMFYRYFTLQNIVLETVIKADDKTYSSFIDEVCKSAPDLESLLTKTNDHPDQSHNTGFEKFSETTHHYFASQDNLKISVISNDGAELESSNDLVLDDSEPPYFSNIINRFGDYLLGVVPNLEIPAKILKGEKVHNILLRNITPIAREKSAFIESYYPIYCHKNISGKHAEHHLENKVQTSLNRSLSGSFSESFSGPSLATLKIVTDISDQWTKILSFEKQVSIFLLTVFAAFFGVIIFNTHHAQRLIDKQAETHKFLEEARIKAEMESSAKTQFLANISHELRTPLHAIIGFSEVIITEAYGKLYPEQYNEYIHDINNSGKHLLSMINDILDFSSASAEKMKIDFIEIDVIKLAASSIRFVKPRADEAKITLIEKFPKDPIVIKADPKRLKQALLNLLSNAVKFTSENGSVTLSIENHMRDNMIKIKIIDTGIGMEEKDIPKALSTFGQIDNKLSRKYEGTGLGLPLTKKLIELMEGKFEITSKPSIGTTVTLTFKQEGF